MLKNLSANPDNSQGRLYPEIYNDYYRTSFQKDRDRIIHSNYFRKLKHKTQVFIESESDYYRTRLTHSLEVSQISRTLCRALNLNEDLGEVVSLAHDLGHPPFGHNGEKTLNDCMRDFGGFNHNDQTLRVITFIEKRYPEFDGLNLTWESLEGIVKHNGIIVNNIPFHTKEYNKKHNLNLDKNPHLESQVAAISDEVAYNNHDVEDALRAKLITLSSLSEIHYFKQIINNLKLNYNNIEESRLAYQVLRLSIAQMVNDIIKQSIKNIKNANVKFLDDIYKYKTFLISMSKEMKENCLIIKDFLFENVYNNNKLKEKRSNVEKITHSLFIYFLDNFDKLPIDWTNQVKHENKHRIICDYISGMTDRYAIKLYKSIYE